MNSIDGGWRGAVGTGRRTGKKKRFGEIEGGKKKKTTTDTVRTFLKQ